jgi:hypothetical protein
VKNRNIREKKTEAKQKKTILYQTSAFIKKKKTKEKQVTTASSDLDLQILTEESQIKKRTQTPCKNKFRVC